MSLEEAEKAALAELEGRFIGALQAKDKGRLDDAEEELRAILRIEPRLAEPHMELGRILIDTERLEEGQEHAREALKLLEAGGQWTDEIPENVMLGLAHALLAEALRRHADEDDVIFGDPDKFKAILAESQEHFKKAAELDPSDEYASYYAFFMGVEGGAPDPLAGEGPAET